MARIMWACWDGGGNLTPSLGIARVLQTRGHEVHFYGRPDMVHRVEAAGLPATALSLARTDLDRYSFHPMASVFGYTSSPAVGEELVDVAQQWDPDVVVIDAMFASALNVAPRFNRPTAVMVHTFIHHMIDIWRGNFTMQSESRQRAGFDGLPGLDVLWGERNILHVNALRAFDGQSNTATWPLTHCAPVLAAERRAVKVELPWGTGDQTPIVLVSFSTVPEQRSLEMLQRALDALDRLPVHVVATTGGIVDPAELTAPENAYLVPFADHDQLMERATMVVGHGGHGTTMRALSHGLPMVGISAKGADQIPRVPWRVADRGVGGDVCWSCATDRATHSSHQGALGVGGRPFFSVRLAADKPCPRAPQPSTTTRPTRSTRPKRPAQRPRRPPGDELDQHWQRPASRDTGTGHPAESGNSPHPRAPMPASGTLPSLLSLAVQVTSGEVVINVTSWSRAAQHPSAKPISACCL